MEALQRDGRASYAELARAVSMSPSAVTERVRRLEESGVIAGYSAVVDPDRLGLDILAFVRLRYPTGNYKPFHDLVAVTPEIIEAHHVTGEDCFILKVVARSMRHLEHRGPYRRARHGDHHRRLQQRVAEPRHHRRHPGQLSSADSPLSLRHSRVLLVFLVYNRQ